MYLYYNFPILWIFLTNFWFPTIFFIPVALYLLSWPFLTIGNAKTSGAIYCLIMLLLTAPLPLVLYVLPRPYLYSEGCLALFLNFLWKKRKNYWKIQDKRQDFRSFSCETFVVVAPQLGHGEWGVGSYITQPIGIATLLLAPISISCDTDTDTDTYVSRSHDNAQSAHKF